MSDDPTTDAATLARRIHRRLLAEFERAYEEAAMQGLCGEGAHEYALDRIRNLDPESLTDDAST